MAKSCVVFSVGVVSTEGLLVLREFLDTLRNYYADTKIFVGINMNAHTDVESVIAEYNLDCEVARLSDESLYLAGDPAGYQLALNLFFHSKETYDVIWFMHTKGGHNERAVERRLYLEHFYPNRKYIEDKFVELPKLGVFGYRGIQYDWNRQHSYLRNKIHTHSHRLVQDVWGDVSTTLFKHTFCGLIIIETMFAMNAEIMYKFLNEYPEFLHTPMGELTQENEIRYYFEGEICNFIPTRMGYYPAVMVRQLWASGDDATVPVRQWITENGFDEYLGYETSLYGERHE